MRWSVGKRRCQKRVLAISCQRTGLRCSGASNITSRLALDSTLAVEAVCHSRHRGKRLSSKRGRHLPALPESAAGTPSGPPSGPSESDTHTHTHARTHARARAHTHTRRRCVAPAGGLVDFWGTAGWCGLRHPHRAGPAAAAGCGAGGSGNRWPRARRWTQSRGVVEGRGCGSGGGWGKGARQRRGRGGGRRASPGRGSGGAGVRRSAVKLSSSLKGGGEGG